MYVESHPKQKILFVVHSLTMGGTERLVFQMAKALKDKFVVGICCLDGGGPFWKNAEDEGVALYSLARRPGLHFKTFYALLKVIQDFKPDIIHAHQYSPYFYSVICKIIRGRKIKLIFTEHGRHYPDKVKWRRRLANQLFLKFTDKVTAVSHFTEQRLRIAEGIRSQPIQVIYNGTFDCEGRWDKKDIRSELGILGDAKVIGYLGSLRQVKNPLSLLRAFQQVSKSESNAVLVYIGEGPLRNDLEKLSNDLGLSGRVFLPGMRNPGEPYLSCFDVFVLPSFSEGTSLALLEAMARSVPVIVSDRGGSPEIVEDGKTGYVVECDNDDALAGAILNILRDPGSAKNMASNARTRVLENFLFQKMIDRYVDLYTA